MSAHEWMAHQYGVLLDEATYKPFTTLEAAENELLYLEFRGVPATLAHREVHTKVSETPWVELPHPKKDGQQ